MDEEEQQELNFRFNKIRAGMMELTALEFERQLTESDSRKLSLDDDRLILTDRILEDIYKLTKFMEAKEVKADGAV